MIMETHDVIDTWIEGIAASLSENWEAEEGFTKALQMLIFCEVQIKKPRHC